MRGRSRAWAMLLLVVPGVAGLIALPAAPAQAHATVVRTVPAEQTQVDTPPDLVSVEFSEPVLDLGTEIKVLAGGETLLDDRAAVDGATISHPLGGELPAGSYQVLWRATSVDGHVISGAYLFSVATGASRPPAATLGTGSRATAPAAGGSGPTGSTGSGGGKAQWMLAALAAAGAALAVLGSRRRLRSAARE